MQVGIKLSCHLQLVQLIALSTGYLTSSPPDGCTHTTLHHLREDDAGHTDCCWNRGYVSFSAFPEPALAANVSASAVLEETMYNEHSLKPGFSAMVQWMPSPLTTGLALPDLTAQTNV